VKYLSFVLVLLSFIAGPPVRPLAAEEGWVPVGPPGGQIMEMRVHPRNPKILWAGTYDSGVFKSTNGGTSWRSVNQGLDRLNVQTLAVAPANPNVLYVAAGGRFYRSSNGGQSWTVKLPCGNLPGCLPLESVLDLVVDPRDPDAVFAATYRGVFKTVDGGAQWRRVPVSHSTSTMVFEPGNPKVAYAAAYHEIYKSTDGGSSWELWNRQSDSMFEYLVTDPKNPRRMWSGTSSFLLRSTDGGRSWRRLENSPYQLSALALTPAAGAGLPVLWAGSSDGIYRSLDGGATWNITLRQHWVNVIATHPQVPDTVWTGVTLSSHLSASGVFKSADRGASWTFSSRGIYRMGAYSLAFDPDTPDVLWTASGAGVLRSADGGLTWTERNRNFLEFSSVSMVAVDPDDAQTIWAVTPSFGVYVSEDGGGRWQQRRKGLESVSIQHLWIAPSATSTVYAVSQGGLFKTVDAGRHWSTRLTPQASEAVTLRDLWIDPRDPDVLIAAWRGLWISRNGGISWAGMPVGADEPEIWSLAVDPRDPNVLYAGGADGVFRSADGGQAWELVADLPVSAQVALAVGSAGEVWAGDQGGIYFSPDGVSGWDLLPGLVPKEPVVVLAADPHHPSTVFASTSASTPAGDLVGLFRHSGD
jgi:photosystem II stability/assembly factor-like uncharacterized protein